MVQCLRVFLVEICFHVEVIISWSEVLLVHLCCILVQCVMVLPGEVFISVPFDLELELPMSFSWFDPSGVYVFLHDVVFFFLGFFLITLLDYGDGWQWCHHSSRYSVFL